MIEKEFLLESYDYKFDDSLIATEPIYPKERAKLLIYKRENGEIIHTTFGEILNYIPEETALIFNNTKVIKARIFGKKLSGGKVEILINRPLGDFKVSIFVKGRVKVDTEIIFEESDLTLKIVELIEDGSRIGEFYSNGKKLNFSELIEFINRIGHIPLPPYIHREDKEADEVDYQPIFAKHSGAVASPTASLHFSEELLKKLEKSHKTAYLTLHVGAGTFKPVDVDDIRDHSLHKEIFQISREAEELLNSKKDILAVGTTVTRTVEYFWRTGEKSGDADIFLHPKNRPERVKYLLTNFHLPKSTLLMLVSSFIGIEEMQRVYKEAVEKRYRFYSYGDAMLIL
jgi:S-adenosylmethionine:tRNA ribosyltransferase-isomerase